MRETFLSFATLTFLESLFVVVALLFPHRRVQFTGILDRFECRCSVYIIGWIAIFTHFEIMYSESVDETKNDALFTTKIWKIFHSH